MGQDENKELMSIFDDEVDEAAKTATYEKNARDETEPPSSKSKGHSLVVWGLGIIIVIILLAVFFRGSRTPGSKDLEIMRERIEHLDARVVRLESFGKKVMSLENQLAALGQTMSRLEAKKYGITVDQLRQLNNLKENQAIYPGQKLLVKSANP